MIPENKKTSLPTSDYIRDLMSGNDQITDTSQHLKAALSRHKSEGQLLAVRARWIALAIIGLFLPFLSFTWDMLYYEALLLGLAFIGWVQLRVGQVGQSVLELRLIFADIALLTFTFVFPNPFINEQMPTAMLYQLDNFNYFYIFLAAATMAYSWRTVFSYATWVAGMWISAAVLVIFLGTKIPEISEKLSAAVGTNVRYLELLDPNNVNMVARVQEVLVFAIVAAILAVNGWRTNRLLLNQADVARERANLARHFPPNIVDQIAARDEPFGTVRSQTAAVMFADIVGFTRLAERQSPEETMSMLRDFHKLMENAVFTNQGTLDKFLGDGIMATFGTPEPTPEDAANALKCARDMLSGIDHWNDQREEDGKAPVILSIGIHYGNVVLGDIGSERLLEFAVIGDAVNVASRLETLTRTLGTRMIVSDSLITSINEVTSANALPSKGLLEGLEAQQEQSLRGRDVPVKVWSLSE